MSQIQRIAILGTGLIGASLGLALRRAGFSGSILGWDRSAAALEQARVLGAVDRIIPDTAPLPGSFAGETNSVDLGSANLGSANLGPGDDPFICALAADVIVLAGPVFSIAEWLQQLAPVLSASQLVTDVGSVKGFLLERAAGLYNEEGKPGYLPGHPMAGKEQSGAAYADGTLFDGAVWLFTPDPSGAAGVEHPFAAEWRMWVERCGARIVDVTAERHDLLCAWVSHLPQMVSTAMSALLHETFTGTFAHDPELHGIGGRALREMTRLGSSPYSMWRDIAHTNAPAIEAALLALEQHLAHLREHLKTPELRSEFEEANAFRAALAPPASTSAETRPVAGGPAPDGFGSRAPGTNGRPPGTRMEP